MSRLATQAVSSGLGVIDDADCSVLCTHTASMGQGIWVRGKEMEKEEKEEEERREDDQEEKKEVEMLLSLFRRLQTLPFIPSSPYT